MAASVNTAEIITAESSPVTSLPDSRPTVSLASRLAQSWTWLKWPVALGILAWLYYQNRVAIAEIAKTPKNWSFAVLAFGLIAGSCLVTFGRWYLLVRAQEFAFGLKDAVRYGFVGMVMNYVAPGAVGGDLFKAVLLARDQSSRRTVAVATVLLDRILGMLALFLVGACTTLLPQQVPDNPQLRLTTALLLGGSLAGLIGLVLMLLPATTRWKWVNRLPNIPRVGKMIGELIHGVRLYQSKPGAVFAALGLSLIGHVGLITGFYFCALWMQQPWIPDLPGHFYFMPTAELFSALIPTPGGMGALEEAVSWFYVQLKPAAIPAAQAAGAGAMAGIAYRVVVVAISAIGYGYYITSRREISAAIEEASHAPGEANAG
ncbi:MAG TPA: lysylphosphatidylglycerol synthase transmembrane domain-containing protein [Planctomycetaceae bacterium]|jgi:hypothetical protein